MFLILLNCECIIISSIVVWRCLIVHTLLTWLVWRQPAGTYYFSYKRRTCLCFNMCSNALQMHWKMHYTCIQKEFYMHSQCIPHAFNMYFECNQHTFQINLTTHSKCNQQRIPNAFSNAFQMQLQCIPNGCKMQSGIFKFITIEFKMHFACTQHASQMHVLNTFHMHSHCIPYSLKMHYKCIQNAFQMHSTCIWMQSKCMPSALEMNFKFIKNAIQLH